MRRILWAALLAMAGCAAAFAQEDDDHLLPAGEGRETVEGICSACHSLRLVAQQGMNRERWDDILHQMVEKQGMPYLDQETRETILGYLAEYLGPERRRGDGLSPFNQPPPLPQ